MDVLSVGKGGYSLYEAIEGDDDLAAVDAVHDLLDGGLRSAGWTAARLAVPFALAIRSSRDQRAGTSWSSMSG